MTKLNQNKCESPPEASSEDQTNRSNLKNSGAGRRTKKSKLAYRTDLGAMFVGAFEDVVKSKKFVSSFEKAQLIFTSPPFPLARQKKYGNFTGVEYENWLAGYAQSLAGLLEPNGSIVMEVGNTWVKGKPVLSTAPLRALLNFLDEANLNLCQEFFWYNPARLPSPAQWVNIDRIRVKDACSRFWWMSPSERPKADNRNILREYSDSMKKLLDKKSYNGGARPSEFVIGEESFNVNNGGAIPPNIFNAEEAPLLSDLLKVSNTKSSDQYLLFCRERGIKSHPARMPPEIVEFFIKFLTDSGDLVIDPFAGSNTTGATAEKLDRRWLSVEADLNYARGSRGHFPATDIKYLTPELRG